MRDGPATPGRLPVKDSGTPPPAPERAVGAGSASCPSLTRLRRAWWLIPGVLWLPTLGLGFFNDDYVGLDTLASIPATALGSVVALEEFQFFRPLGLLTFRWILALAGPNPLLFHAMTLAVFFLAAWLGGVLVGRLLGRQAKGWGVALALAYPGRVETAAWVASLFDLYALLLTTAALVVAAGRWQRPWRSAGVLASLSFLAVLYKESALVVPVVVGCWQALRVFPVDTPSVNRLRLVAAAVGAGGSFAARFPFLGGVGGYEGVGIGAWLQRAEGLPELLLRLFLWPANPFYLASLLVNVAVAAAMLALAAAWVRRHRREWRLVAAGAALALVGMLPALGYLDPSQATYTQSRYLTIAALGVVLVTARWAGEGNWIWGALVLGSWMAAMAVNLHPWYEAADRQKELLARIEELTRGEGRHVVWVGGELDLWRGAQQLGGRLPIAVRRQVGNREVMVVSVFDQRLRSTPPCPPAPQPGSTLHLVYLASEAPWVRTGVPEEYDCPPGGGPQ